jgi:hypothetical protein
MSLWLIIRSMALPTHDVRLIGRYERGSLAGFPFFGNGMMVARLHCCGHVLEVQQLL